MDSVSCLAGWGGGENLVLLPQAPSVLFTRAPFTEWPCRAARCLAAEGLSS